jgi:E3 ubiquitin-protein ligase RNF139
MIDAFRTSMWEQLDDYVYYIRSTGNSIEFIFGIFLFFNGAWILLFESGGTIRALMMCIHAYFNIWLQAKAGIYSIQFLLITIQLILCFSLFNS